MGNTTTLGNKSKFRELLDSFGLPRLIIACFLLLLLIAAPCVGLDFPTQITNIITRFSWNAVMVLAMVPMVHSGCGLNFGLPLGIVSGLLGATLSIELGYTGFASFLMAILIATPFALLFGGGYGWLLNKIKGGEMMIATYVGFSSVSFMCMMWPFLHTKTGTAMTAVGSNPAFARAAGINVDKMRLISVIMSTWLGAVGILVYEQGFGFIQLYNGPFWMAMPAVAAILIGGASVNKASIGNVIIGTILYQGVVTMTPTVMSAAFQMDMSEVIRIVVSNGMILYALTRKTERGR